VELAAPVRPAKVVVEKPVPEETGPDPRLDGARYYALGRPRAKPVLDGQGGPEEFEPPKHGPVVDADAAYDTDPVETKSASYDRPAKSSPGKFIWPVQGKVISSFGRRTSGLHNDGINIAAEPGTKVLAADDGIVVYAGNELTSYGNLLLLRHPSGYVTAYAHNKKLLVKPGASVKQGDAVAIVGSTGNVDRPQLHFEVRQGERAVDPYRFLSRATASR
jgi:murein DD-endopeptidase MepM/ murein hydrolase activator NlpD